MARAGIYVNGKEIVARYLGDKLVWKKRRVAYVMELSTWNIDNGGYTLSGYVFPNNSTVPVQTFVLLFPGCHACNYKFFYQIGI